MKVEACRTADSKQKSQSCAHHGKWECNVGSGIAECADRIVTILDGKVCSNVVQDEEAKQRNRDALFADLKGDLNIGGEAAKEHTTEKPAPAEKA